MLRALLAKDTLRPPRRDPVVEPRDDDDSLSADDHDDMNDAKCADDPFEDDGASHSYDSAKHPGDPRLVFYFRARAPPRSVSCSRFLSLSPARDAAPNVSLAHKKRALASCRPPTLPCSPSRLPMSPAGTISRAASS